MRDFKSWTRTAKHISGPAICTQPHSNMYKPTKKTSAIIEISSNVISPQPNVQVHYVLCSLLYIVASTAPEFSVSSFIVNIRFFVLFFFCCLWITTSLWYFVLWTLRNCNSTRAWGWLRTSHLPKRDVMLIPLNPEIWRLIVILPLDIDAILTVICMCVMTSSRGK